MGARWYNPRLGRWISADTIVPDPGDSQSFNRYAYVDNNPLRYVDPNGHDGVPPEDYARKAHGAWSRVKAFVAPLIHPLTSGWDRARAQARSELSVDSTVDQRKPWGNVGEMLVLSLLGVKEAVLGDGAVSVLQGDAEFQAFEQEVLGNALAGDEQYGRQVAFGGATHPDPKLDQVIHVLTHFADPADWLGRNTYAQTWDVAESPQTWMVRNAGVTANATVNGDGSVMVNYYLRDEFDLDPQWGQRDPMYNVVCALVGPIWHDILRGSDMIVEANWTTTYIPK
jgi:hypothetical protein